MTAFTHFMAFSLVACALLAFIFMALRACFHMLFVRTALCSARTGHVSLLLILLATKFVFKNFSLGVLAILLLPMRLSHCFFNWNS